MPKIPWHVKVFVEGELRAYRENKIELEKLRNDRQDTYYRSRQRTDEPVQGSHSGDPTYSKVVQLERIEGMVVYLERRISCVDAGLKMCTREERELLESRYMGEYEPTDQETIYCLRYGFRNKYFKIKDAAILKIAKAFGVYDERWKRGEKY